MNAVLCRYGELFLKAGNRGLFERALTANIRRALRGVPGVRIQEPHGRMLVRADESTIDDVCSRVERVFGLVSVSPVAVVPSDMANIKQAAVACAGAALAREPDLRRGFKVEARRSDKNFPLTSYQIACEVGDAVFIATSVPVNVTAPALTVGVEVGTKETYVFGQSRPAPGGLPVGASGRALLLLSGGIDSPVAAWLSAKRGLALDAVYFHSPPFIGEKSKDKVVSLGKILAGWQALDSLFVVGFTGAQKKLRDVGPAPLGVVLYRRMMMRVADLIADRTQAAALVTGENLGQVASQTIENLGAIEAAARLLVLRPLLTYDKMETTALAKRIGTYDTSILPYDDCCSLFVPPHPSVAARLSDLERAEAALDVTAEAAAMAASAERIEL